MNQDILTEDNKQEQLSIRRNNFNDTQKNAEQDQTIDGMQQTQQEQNKEETQIEEKQKQQKALQKITKDSFEFQGKLGDGSYGKVFLVKHKTSGNQYALKCLDKVHIIKHDKIEGVQRERDNLQLSKHPNVVSLECTFQDEDNLYFLLEYVPNGSLSGLLKQIKPLPLELAKYYAAELVSVLEFLHGNGICHRDLKPENILLDAKYHVKLSDFGDSKKFNEKKEVEDVPRTSKKSRASEFSNHDKSALGRGTFVGTPLYVAPEMLEGNVSGPFTDLWALGCIIFQSLTGDVPFKANFDFQVFQMITDRKLSFPQYLPEDAVDLIDKLMQLDPHLRLGGGPQGSDLDYEHLKAHPFFKGINFKKLSQIAPPIPMERFQAAFKNNQNVKQDVVEHLVEEVNSNEQRENEDRRMVLDEMLVKTGLVLKKKGIVKNKNIKLTLTNQPRLYQSTENGEYKSDILITAFVKAVTKGSNRFDITCSKSGKVYSFSVTGEDSSVWVAKINRVIEAATR